MQNPYYMTGHRQMMFEKEREYRTAIDLIQNTVDVSAFFLTQQVFQRSVIM